ncbi:MAG: ABC transporter transmembrane domain-containing protein [Alphaproteobacteria bacterium]|nr:ABC transporter transmembrane domain-containing protein [Alphaproteobacteria bacterium]
MTAPAPPMAERHTWDRTKLRALVSRDQLIHRLHGAGFEILAATLFLNLLALALPLSILHIYDRVIPNNSRDTLVLLILGVGAVLIIDAILRLARAHLNGWAAARFEHNLSCCMMEQFLSADLASYEKIAPGAHMERMAAIDVLRDFYSGQLALVLIDLPFALLFLGLIGYLAGSLVLVPLIILVVFALAAGLTGRRLKAALKTRDTVGERRYSFIVECLTGVHTLKALAMEAQMARRYERLHEASSRAEHDVIHLNGRAQTIGAFASNLTPAAVVGFGSLFVMDGSLTIGGLTACMMLAGRSLQPLLRAMGIWSQFQNVQVAKDRIVAVLDMKTERSAYLPKLPFIAGGIYLYGVHYSHENYDSPLLTGVTLRIEPGTTVAIRGADGSGKSTILGLILGVRRPTSGRIMIDNHLASAYDPVSVRKQIAYMPQHGVLYRGSILDNLTNFSGGEAIDRALEVATAVGLNKVIARLPKGYQTEVGDSSVEKLPAGTVQMITIARALVSNAPIILFDEADSFLDSKGSDLIRRALKDRKGTSTIVIVSHRPSVLRLADQVYNLEAGKLRQLALPSSRRIDGLAKVAS